MIVTATTVIPVTALIADLGAQTVEALVQILALPAAQAAAAVARFQLDQLPELGAQVAGFPAAQRAVADALVDPMIQTVKAALDTVPVPVPAATALGHGRNGGGEGGHRNQGQDSFLEHDGSFRLRRGNAALTGDDHFPPEPDLNGTFQVRFMLLNGAGPLPRRDLPCRFRTMSRTAKPIERPARPFFSSGPTAKPPGWRMADLSDALMGRNIRAEAVTARFHRAHELTRSVLEIPSDHALCFMPASDTGAVEAALWNLLGERPVQVLAFDNFGKLWASDVVDHLGLDAEILSAPYGELPDLPRVRSDHDLVFAWNGTTSGVRVPDAGFIAADRTGLTICDATSAAFAMPLDWAKLDVVTFSFQKALGGDAGIGALILSPRAIERLNHFVPDRPIPKVLRLRGAEGFDRVLAEGNPLNTYSILTLEDWIAALEWAEGIGGLPALIARTEANFAALSEWVERTPWIDFLARDAVCRSETSVCLRFVGPAFEAMSADDLAGFLTRFRRRLADEGAALDIESHRAAPAGLRIWCGATVDEADVRALAPWLDWAFGQERP